ncbi:hypothetical protein FB382_002888 [Nocardioides ginsengisegetis]|uniref:TIGR02569 family protein n=1 Tax=Nocardioides ginsengisegetis TaxID=661491 RepID=A0A7W3PAL6_9ACTN|nr:hypothetical protein [Nocardioides ginsengisegetis]MBA8804597.1 hypothetical protein [Nocardioides ginsengisegetis]
MSISSPIGSLAAVLPSLPSPRVLDLFAVPDDPRPLPGGQGASVRAGDLVLSPGRDQETQAWLSPVLARLAVRLDEDPHRTARDLRVAMPVPARDGTWVVDGWAASRYEPGTESCHDLEVVRRTGDLLHAQLAVEMPRRPAALDGRVDRWAVAERMAFGEAPVDRDDLAADLARSLLAGLAPAAAPAGLVHADLAGNVLLDLAGAPVVIDVSPAWRPASWADAVCVLDSVLWRGADPARLDDPPREDLLRAVVFRVLSDDPADVTAYAAVAERAQRIP